MTDYPRQTEYPMSKDALTNLYPKLSKPAEKGKSNRVPRQFTIQPETDNQWRLMMQDCIGVQPTRGNGVSSPLVELAMRLFVAISTGTGLDSVARELSSVLHADGKSNLKSRLIQIANLL